MVEQLDRYYSYGESNELSYRMHAGHTRCRYQERNEYPPVKTYEKKYE